MRARVYFLFNLLTFPCYWNSAVVQSSCSVPCKWKVSCRCSYSQNVILTSFLSTVQVEPPSSSIQIAIEFFELFYKFQVSFNPIGSTWLNLMGLIASWANFPSGSYYCSSLKLERNGLVESNESFYGFWVRGCYDCDTHCKVNTTHK